MVRRVLLAAVLAGSCGGDGAAFDAAPVSPDAGPATGSWSSVAPLLGGPRQEIGVAATGGIVYVLGGFDDGGGLTGALTAYDPVTDSWSARSPFPASLHHANFVAAGGHLWVAGSLRGSSFSADGGTWKYDVEIDLWAERTPMPGGTARGAAGVAVVGTKLYVVGGGYRPSAVADFSAYDTDVDAWSTLPDLPQAREHLVAGGFGDLVVVIGGRDGIENHAANVDIFDTGTEVWTEGASMPTSRGGAAAAVLGGRMYVMGGEGNAQAASGVFDVVESYDPAANAWATHTPMATPRHGTGAAAVGGKIYVPGGADVQAFGAVDVVEVFTP